MRVQTKWIPYRLELKPPPLRGVIITRRRYPRDARIRRERSGDKGTFAFRERTTLHNYLREQSQSTPQRTRPAITAYIAIDIAVQRNLTSERFLYCPTT